MNAHTDHLQNRPTFNEDVLGLDTHLTAFNLGHTVVNELNNYSRFADGCSILALVIK